MKNRSVLKHSLRTGSLSSLECFNTHIRKSVLEIWGIHILGIMPALHVGQKSSILLSSTKLWLGSSVWQNVGLQNQMSEVRILPGSPNKYYYEKIYCIG